ncbi:MAG: cupin domain-containing protein [Patescibacteria group bacterium]
MMGYVVNLEEKTKINTNFRTVLYTAGHSQLVVMNLKAGEDIGMEAHPDVDQFIRVESGVGKVIMNGEESAISDGFAFVIPAGTNHNVVNTGDTEMKLYTVYTPPNHKDGTVHVTKADAEAAEALEHQA